MIMTIKAIDHFGELMAQGFDKINQACKVYVEAIDSNPELKSNFIKAYPDIPAGVWARYELVGRGGLDYRLLWIGGPGPRMLKKMPISDQKKYIEKPVDLLLSNGDKIKVDIRKLRPKQAKQVFADDHVRDAAEQRAWIEDQNTQSNLKANKDAKQPYRIENGFLVVGKIKFGKKDLHRILIRMENEEG